MGIVFSWHGNHIWTKWCPFGFSSDIGTYACLLFSFPSSLVNLSRHPKASQRTGCIGIRPFAYKTHLIYLYHFCEGRVAMARESRLKGCERKNCIRLSARKMKHLQMIWNSHRCDVDRISTYGCFGNETVSKRHDRCDVKSRNVEVFQE